MDGLAGLAAESDEDIGGDVGMLGEPSQRAVELTVIGAIVLHGAALLMSDGHHAIDLRIVLEQVAGANPVRDVFAGAGRAVDRADDGYVVARAVTERLRPLRPAVIAH